MNFLAAVSFVIVSFFLVSCARGPIKDTGQAMRPYKGDVDFFDDLAGGGLREALRANIMALKVRSNSQSMMRFGSREIPTSVYIKALESLLDQLPESEEKSSLVVGGISPFQNWKAFLKENFELYEIYGRKNWGEVFITSYYVPVIPGSRRKTSKFSQPLYRVPKDMVKVEIGEFSKIHRKLAELYNEVMEQKSPTPILRGRLVKQKGGSASYRVRPYFDRREIDELKKLKGRRLEIVWVDPVEAFFLQIQGSGIVELPGGQRLRVGYASQNGHPYVAIGKFLFDRIPREKMSLQTIEAELRKMSNKEMQSLLNKNPSYVFFRKLKGEAVGYLGAEVVAGRTIATDTKFFPKGALAYLEFEKPVFDGIASTEPSEWKKSSRFVLDQDTGGAIRGPGRLDLFWGQGAEARQVAGVMKNLGNLKYLVPKPAFVQRLSQIELTQR